MKSADYWRGRFFAIEELAHKEAEKSTAVIEDFYREAQLSVQREIESWYQRFATGNGISMSEARKRLNAGQLEEFRWTVEQYVQIGRQQNLSPEWIKKLENASVRFHVSRLEAIQVGIQQQMELLYGNQVDKLDSLLRQMAGNGYTHTVFEIQKGLGLGWDVTAFRQDRLEALLKKPWTTDGKTFRDRCWADIRQDLANKLHKELTQSLLRGDPPEKLIQSIRKEFGVSRYKARRLVHTEASYFNAVSTQHAYQELGVKQLEILETLDSHTCEICGGLDGKVVLLSEYEPGVTVPPFHPNCRGTTVPYYDDMDGERTARNAEGNVYYVPANMTYSEWKKAFVDGGKKDALQAVAKDDIMHRKGRKEGSDVHYVGKLDKKIYSCVTLDITTEDVIITDERIQHIMERHPEDYERFCSYIPGIISDPDYIIEANKSNTGVLLKEMEENGERFKLILRLRIPSDPEEYKNSVLSFWKIGETTWKKSIKNKKILYKKE